MQVVTAIQRWCSGIQDEKDLEIIMACPALAPEIKNVLTSSDPQVCHGQMFLHTRTASTSSCLGSFYLDLVSNLSDSTDL